MDPKKNFTEDDKKKIVNYLNLIAKHAKFNVETSELIEYFKTLSYMQQTLLPKIEANYFEILRVVEPKDTPEHEDE